MIEKIIEYIIITVVLGSVGAIIQNAIKKAIASNIENSKKILSTIEKIDIKVGELSREFIDMKIELPEKYLRCLEFEKFKEENRDAHKELRTEMHELIERRSI